MERKERKERGRKMVEKKENEERERVGNISTENEALGAEEVTTSQEEGVK